MSVMEKANVSKMIRRTICLFFFLCLFGTVVGCNLSQQEDATAGDTYVLGNKHEESRVGEQENNTTSSGTGELWNTTGYFREEKINLDLPMTPAFIAAGGDRIYFLGSDMDEAANTVTDYLVSCAVDGSDVHILLCGGASENGGLSVAGETIYAMGLESPIAADDEGNLILIGQTEKEEMILSKFSPTGETLWTSKREDFLRANRVACAGEMIAVSALGEILICDGDGTEVKKFPVESGFSGVSDLAVVNGGQVLISYWEQQGNMSSMVWEEIDPETGKKIDRIEADWVGYSVTLIPGRGCDLLLWDTGGINQYNLDDRESMRIIRFTDSDISGGDLVWMSLLGENDFLAAKQAWGETNIELYRFREISAAEMLGDKQEVTFGFLYRYSKTMEEDIARINRESELCHVKLINYSAYNTEDNPSGGITALNNDIAAGKAPDVLVLDDRYMPVASYIRMGAFEDLNPWLERGGNVERSDLLDNLLRAYSTGDSLYRIPVEFEVYTVTGLASVLGDKNGWTFDEFGRLMEEYPDSSAFVGVTAEHILVNYLKATGDQFMDWESGTCRFDSQEFIDLLEWAARFPLQADEWLAIGEAGSYRDGSALMAESRIAAFDRFRSDQTRFGGVLTYIGYPTADRNGSYLEGGLVLAMSAKSEVKEAAWELISSFLTREYQQGRVEFPGVLPARADVLKEAAERATWEDPHAKSYLEINGIKFDEEPLTEDEAQRYLTFLTSVDRAAAEIGELLPIITEEAGSLFAGQKTAEAVAKIIQSRAALYLAERQ